jgi:hypothetical protein
MESPRALINNKHLWWVIPVSFSFPALLATWAYLLYMIFAPSACVYPCDPELLKSGFFLYSVISVVIAPYVSVFIPPVGLALSVLVLAEISYFSGWKMPVLKVVSLRRLWLVVVAVNVLAWLVLGIFAVLGNLFNVFALVGAPIIGVIAAASAGIVVLCKKLLTRRTVIS